MSDVRRVLDSMDASHEREIDLVQVTVRDYRLATRTNQAMYLLGYEEYPRVLEDNRLSRKGYLDRFDGAPTYRHLGDMGFGEPMLMVS